VLLQHRLQCLDPLASLPLFRPATDCVRDEWAEVVTVERRWGSTVYRAWPSPGPR
jgi:hypothetical protein